MNAWHIDAVAEYEEGGMDTGKLEEKRHTEPQQTLQIRVRDLLDQVAQYHDRVSGFYRTYARAVKEVKVCLLLEHLAAHEQEMAGTVREIVAQSDRQILDAWIKAAPGIEARDWLDDLEVRADASVDDVNDVVRELSELLDKSLSCLEFQPNADNIKQFFETFCERERLAKVRAMRSAEGQA